MKLIPESFTVLGKPPSFASCTRDTFAPEQKLNSEEALSIAQSIAQAVSELHAQGVMHGDLYAHNILINKQQALLTDFGAASVIDYLPAAQQNALINIEKRAYGCLLEDIIQLINTPSSPVYALLRDLRDQLADEQATYPSWSNILQQFSTAIAR